MGQAKSVNNWLFIYLVPPAMIPQRSPAVIVVILAYDFFVILYIFIHSFFENESGIHSNFLIFEEKNILYTPNNIEPQ